MSGLVEDVGVATVDGASDIVDTIIVFVGVGLAVSLGDEGNLSYKLQKRGGKDTICVCDSSIELLVNLCARLLVFLLFHVDSLAEGGCRVYM